MIKNVLIVAADDSLREVLARILQEMKMGSMATDNCDEGLRRVLAQGNLPAGDPSKIDLVIADLMYNKSGKEMVKSIQGSGIKIPTILMTAEPGHVAEALRKELGVPVLLKPFMIMPLYDAILMAVSGP
ncbi:MAG TPA: hypothetical protein VHD69_02160 [Candidatus Paceibacterota bacterium]|nr:hypothetical protein [Candidatus Paceibacterota bacterium]